MGVRVGGFLTPPIFFVKLKNKVKHFKDQKCYAIGYSNLCINHLWHVFFDADGSGENLKKAVDDIGLEGYFIKTKHGVQFISKDCYSLASCYNVFVVLKERVKTDYFWSIPLWLRLTAKESITGEVSPPPKISKELMQFIGKHFPLKKLYSTWD